MHELLLYGQVPSARHSQVLGILAGVAAMQPVAVVEKHLVFKPKRGPGSARGVQVGAAQDIQKAGAQTVQAQTQGDLYYVQMVGEGWYGEEGGEGEGADVVMGGEGNEGTEMASAYKASNPEKWTLQFRDLPEVARQRPVTSRFMADIPITSGDPMQFMTALDYSHISSYLLSGHRFTHLSTSLLLFRLLVPSKPPSQHQDATNINVSQARLLDPSGTYILQAAVRVQDGSKVETMTKGMNELLSLKETLKGVVEMEVGERLALDTRVR